MIKRKQKSSSSYNTNNAMSKGARSKDRNRERANYFSIFFRLKLIIFKCYLFVHYIAIPYYSTHPDNQLWVYSSPHLLRITCHKLAATDADVMFGILFYYNFFFFVACKLKFNRLNHFSTTHRCQYECSKILNCIQPKWSDKNIFAKDLRWQSICKSRFASTQE